MKTFWRRLFTLLKWTVIPGSYPEMEASEIVARRKRYTRFLIIGAILLFIVMTMAALFLQESGIDAPISNNLAVALVLNLEVLLMVVLALLVLRNLIKLYFERRGQMAGARFQTKLVIAFLAMTLVPSVMMFAVATELISDTIDKWLNARVEQTLKQSLQVAEGLYHETEERVADHADYLSGLVRRRGLMRQSIRPSLFRLLRQKLREYNIDLIQVYDAEQNLVSEAIRPEARPLFASNDRLPEVVEAIKSGKGVSAIDDQRGVARILSVATIGEEGTAEIAQGAVVVVKVVSRQNVNLVHSITRAFENYKQLTIKKEIIKASYQVTLALVALVIIFSAIWIGFYLAKGITVPLTSMLEATESVAAGNLNVHIDLPTKRDEVGLLIDAFNKMTHDLRTSKGQLEKANRDLTVKNDELHHWGQYIEAVLDTGPGGVVSIDKKSAITTINGAAARMFGLNPDTVRGRNYRKVFDASLLAPVRLLIREMGRGRRNSIEKEIDYLSGEEPRKLRVSVSLLRDNNDQYMGLVLVFNDLTEILAAQRSTAWREMARVVAHEIKNPLTPIQLNVQRMRRKFEMGADDFPAVFTTATDTIIQEVGALKELVGDFSQLAKQVDVRPADTGLADVKMLDLQREQSSLHDVITEVSRLYANVHPSLSLRTELDPSIGLVNIDADQIKRVLTNLMENALHALDDAGEIAIRTYRKKGAIVIDVADNGPGVSDAVKEKLFRPYFSTRPEGAGLGLAIVARIVEDHGGSVFVEDNEPKGARFSIELPGD